MLDYIIVGLGLAGVSFCETLEKHNKSFVVVTDTSQVASMVAAGLYNPVILKRFTLAWKAREQLQRALPFYAKLQTKLGVALDYKIPVYRRFTSYEEQNQWFEASDKDGLSQFLSSKVHPNKNRKIKAPFGFGEVKGTGKIDTRTLLVEYKKYLKGNNKLVEETLAYKTLQVGAGTVAYKSLKAKNIVFCEGFGLKKNPFFNYLPLTGTKGEYLIVHAPQLKEEKAIKASIFCIPEQKDSYRVGATYKWKDTSNIPTEATKKELLEKLASFVQCDYHSKEQLAGIRPTVTDRKPLVGQHPEYKNLFVLNGFGSRGVLIAPYAAEQLYGFIEENTAIDTAIDIHRFKKKYKNAIV